jgi:hypothetical protein
MKVGEALQTLASPASYSRENRLDAYEDLVSYLLEHGSSEICSCSPELWGRVVEQALVDAGVSVTEDALFGYRVSPPFPLVIQSLLCAERLIRADCSASSSRILRLVNG